MAGNSSIWTRGIKTLSSSFWLLSGPLKEYEDNTRAGAQKQRNVAKEVHLLFLRQQMNNGQTTRVIITVLSWVSGTKNMVDYVTSPNGVSKYGVFEPKTVKISAVKCKEVIGLSSQINSELFLFSSTKGVYHPQLLGGLSDCGPLNWRWRTLLWPQQGILLVYKVFALSTFSEKGLWLRFGPLLCWSLSGWK